MDNFDNIDQYELNFNKIIEDRNMLSVTRLLASSLLNKPYMAVGDFIKSLSDDDLDVLLDTAELMEQNDDKAPHTEELVLITEMLVRAEGLTTPDSDVLVNRINALCTFLACEGLSRKGLVKLHHQNMSFGEDMGHKILVEKVEGVDYDDYT